MSITSTMSTRGIDMFLCRFARMAAGGLLAASAARHVCATDLSIDLETWTSRDWAQLQAGILAATASLWFLFPSLFLSSLDICRKGRARLLISLVFLGIAAYLMSFLLWLLADTASPLRSRVDAPVLIYAYCTFVVVYLYAFILPGKAFAFADRPDPIPQTAFLDTAIRSKSGFRPGLVLRPICLLLLLVFWGAGWYGLYRANWLPAPDLVAQVNQTWPVISAITAILTLILFYGSGLGQTAAWRRNGGRRVLLSFAAIAVSLAFVTPAMTRGLPWAASFLMPNEGGTADVIVTERFAGDRKTPCGRSASVSLTTKPTAPVHICAIPDDIWPAIEPGTVLKLTGTRTAFGLRYSQIALP